MFINNGGLWKQASDIFISVFENGSMIWKQILNGFISVFENGSMLWKQFFGDNAPTVVTKPTIRTTNTSGTGTIYDGPVASSPQYLDVDLFGKDGTYTNYTSISGRKFTQASTANASTRTTIVNDDRFTSAGGVTSAMRSAVDNQYLFYEITVANGTDPLDSIQSVSDPVQMIKRFPDINTYGWTGDEAVGVQLAFNYNLVNYYYNSVEKSYSYVKWWRSTNTSPGGTLIKQETIYSTYTTETSSSLSGVSYYTPTSSDLGYYIVAEIIAVNSWTRYQGYVDNYSLASFPTYGPITSPLSISNGRIEDYYNNRGLDNRLDLPVGVYNRLKATISGVDSNTTYRVRYRMYNWQNATYYNMLTGASGTASSVWTTYTADSAGSGNISSVTISNGTATLEDVFSVDATYFGSTTYSGGQYRWQVEIELSAIKTGGSRVYWVNPYQSYYIQPSANSTISVSPTTISPGSSTTISGSFSGYPSGTAYPYQYKVNFGDGTDSGWLPVGGYSYGTGNPSYSISHTYSTAGTYYPSITTIPYYANNSTTLNVASNLQTPTILSASQSGPSGPLTVTVSGGGPTYQIYWSASSSAPSNTVTPDGTSSTTTIVDNTGAGSTGTWYVYARSALTESTYGSTYSTAPSEYISSWSTGYQYVVTATRYLYYDANGGSGAPTTQTGTDSGSGATLTISNTTPTRSGYTFNGWNTNSSGTGTNYSSGGSITLTSDVTLYAKWTQNNLTAPAISSISGTAGNINVYFSGGTGPYYQVYWYPTNRSDIQTVISYDANGSSSPINVTNLASPTAGATYYFWVRSVSSLTNTGTGPSANISSWSGSSTWTAPVIAPSLTSFTISPTTPNVGTTITVTANWANSPTSVSTKITRGTQFVADFEPTVSGPNASSTASYTIQSGDIGYYLAGFSTASNSGGTTGPSKTTSPVEIGPIVQPFVTPTWTGSFPSWTSSNFQRVTSGTANFRWGWGNGSFSWSGSTSGSGGWDFNISSTQLSTTATRSVSVTKNYTTSNDTYQTVNSTNYPYLVSSLRGDVTYSSSSRWGSIRPWINGTDNNKYTASSWSTGV